MILKNLLYLNYCKLQLVVLAHAALKSIRSLFSYFILLFSSHAFGHQWPLSQPVRLPEPNLRIKSRFRPITIRNWEQVPLKRRNQNQWGRGWGWGWGVEPKDALLSRGGKPFLSLWSVQQPPSFVWFEAKLVIWICSIGNLVTDLFSFETDPWSSQCAIKVCSRSVEVGQLVGNELWPKKATKKRKEEVQFSNWCHQFQRFVYLTVVHGWRTTAKPGVYIYSRTQILTTKITSICSLRFSLSLLPFPPYASRGGGGALVRPLVGWVSERFLTPQSPWFSPDPHVNAGRGSDST